MNRRNTASQMDAHWIRGRGRGGTQAFVSKDTHRHRMRTFSASCERSVSNDAPECADMLVDSRLGRPMSDPRPWDRRLWGIKFTCACKEDPPLLLGSAWHKVEPESYAGEPTRALIFTTRQSAREWCATERAKYADRTDCCAHWRFRPIRVQELVRPL